METGLVGRWRDSVSGFTAEKAEWVKASLVARMKFLNGGDAFRLATVQSFREGHAGIIARSRGQIPAIGE
ncbi:hypothetical protein ACSBOB_26420 [Mesorhizobium sp. ASY16-5R]|uniref:hypothetical protein n=1 Tax=Mesorhizobium sp. ASY16-5R TaxID=3445772 RepID=UPI003F9FCE16